MSDLPKRVAARVAADSDDDSVDLAEGVLTKYDLGALDDKSAWKGYTFKCPTWTWAADVYEDQDEPDDWGDQKEHGPVMTLDEALESIEKPGFKGWEWIGDKSDGTFDSGPKKTKKVVTRISAVIERVDGEKLSYNEIKHIAKILKIK